MIDHVMLKVRDYEASKAFYAAALMPLGMKVIKEVGCMRGFVETSPCSGSIPAADYPATGAPPSGPR